ARPLLSQEVLERIISALNESKAVTAAIPVTDTVVRADADAFVAETPDRSLLWQVQTPQGFDLYTIKEAYRRIDPAELPRFTDDGGVVRHVFPEIAVKLVPGSRRLMKLTYPEDLTLLSALL
ncbi:MAG: 2-C-methyl-D-erythritol 4-phosphate cytidylyltransferase, partial [Clostridia bacterium]|nr:2-C-methyl-D-erythritol 4-phosphate cytidylyltransferase [Clostridia bacterium]